MELKDAAERRTEKNAICMKQLELEEKQQQLEKEKHQAKLKKMEIEAERMRMQMSMMANMQQMMRQGTEGSVGSSVAGGSTSRVQDFIQAQHDFNPVEYGGLAAVGVEHGMDGNIASAPYDTFSAVLPVTIQMKLKINPFGKYRMNRSVRHPASSD
jgi:hypothetical protein